MKDKIKIDNKEYDVLFTYEEEDKNYVVFTDGKYDEDKNLIIYGKRYNKETHELFEIETEQELLMLEVLKNDFKRKTS